MPDVRFSLPLWYLRNTKQSSPNDIVTGTASSGGIVALIFRTEDKAKVLVKSNAIFVPTVIDDRCAYLTFLDSLEQKEITHVAIDPTDRQVERVTIADARKALDDPHWDG